MTAATGRLQSHWVRINGQEVHYLRSMGPEPPNKTPVVLLHGIMAGCSFERVGEYLAPYYRVYVPDMPGIGESDKPDHVLELADMVEMLLTWMDNCGIEKAHFAAQSFGCNMAVETAALFPQRIASLTLQALTLEPSRRSVPALFPFWLLAELRETPRGETKKKGQRGVSSRGSAALIKALLGHRIEHRLPMLQCPTLVLHGSHDFIVSRRWAQRATALIPDGRLVIVPRGTHTMNARQPEVYSEAFLDFMAEIEARKSTSEKGETHAA